MSEGASALQNPVHADATADAGPRRSPSAVSGGSLSDLSRPSSSLFSRSTDLSSSSRISVLSVGDSDPGGASSSSSLRPHPASDPPAQSDPRRSPPSATTAAAVYGQTKPLPPRPTPRPHPQSEEPLSRSQSLHQRPPTDPDPSASWSSCPSPQRPRPPSASWSSCPSPQRPRPPSASWSSCPSPQRPRPPSASWSSCPSSQRPRPPSGSGPQLTPSSSVTRLESQRWSVLPPISPVRGRCGTAASRYSELSCSHSGVFDELEAIAPPSISCPSLDESADSSGRLSPDSDLSPGLAALTVGCDSGDLGSLSRVQLLLLDRVGPETGPRPLYPDEDDPPDRDWSDDPDSAAGVPRLLTAGGGSERCDPPGEVQEDRSDPSEGGSRSSWIIDPSPSFLMFGSSPDGGGPDRRDRARRRSPDHGAEEKERKRKALSILSKLQEDAAPPPPGNGAACSDFEDFDFLAKFCIFSPEKLSEYKRAFEAEDSDGDGYISCLQVLLALKNIIPPELLSDEEEIYVYRILEMVDFRVTDGLVDLRLFAVISSLAQKIATMDDFMRSLISDMDFRSLEVRLFKAKQLFLFLLEEQRDAGAPQGFISAEQLLLELKAGGIRLDQEAAVRLELQGVPPLDLLDFLAYLPLFMLIHKSVIANPLEDFRDP